MAPKPMVSAVRSGEQTLPRSERGPLGFMPGQCG
jgi:hypothetical protein